MRIEIVPDIAPDKHICTITLSDEFKLLPYPVQGQSTDSPWVKATGSSPEHALNEAYKAIGQSVVYAMRNCDVQLTKKAKENESS